MSKMLGVRGRWHFGICLGIYLICVVSGSEIKEKKQINKIILRRARKAGSGTIAKFFTREVEWRQRHNILPSNITLILDEGTTKPFDSCCIAPCAHPSSSNQAWSSSEVFTVAHIREPIEWRRTEYYYHGAGSELIKPSNSSMKNTPKSSERMWVEWMTENDKSLKPNNGNCGNDEELVGYENRFEVNTEGKKKYEWPWHVGFGFYQPDFMVRNSIAECGCPMPFVFHGKRGGRSYLGNCYSKEGGSLTYLADSTTGEYPELSADLHLKRAMDVLSRFDLLIPTDYLSHPLLTRFVLWKMNWLYPCDGNIMVPATRPDSRSTSGRSTTGKDFNLVHHPPIGFGHAHQTIKKLLEDKEKNGEKDSISKDESALSRNTFLYMPECIKSELQKQNKLDTLLYNWAESRFKAEIEAFATLPSDITCLTDSS